MYDDSTYVVAAAFGDGAGASRALQRLRASQTRALVGFVDAAVLGRDAGGRLALCDAACRSRQRGLWVGAVTAGVCGLVAGPDRWEVLGGDVVGALAARLEAAGFPGEGLCALGAGLLPGSSVLVAQLRADWVAPITGDLARPASGIVLERLLDETARDLRSCGALVYRRGAGGAAEFVTRVGARPAPGSAGCVQPATGGGSGSPAPASVTVTAGPVPV